MHRGERRLRINTGICCLILTLLVVILDTQRVNLLAPMEHWLYDRRCRYFQFFTPPPTDRLVHLDLDDEALEDVGAWPWPRGKMAAILDEIREAVQGGGAGHPLHRAAVAAVGAAAGRRVRGGGGRRAAGRDDRQAR